MTDDENYQEFKKFEIEYIESISRITTWLLNEKELSMHYRNGREAKNGDIVIQLDSFNPKINAFGVLHSATPGNDFCNGHIAPIQNPITGACMCDCLHVDDVIAILKEHGLDVRPRGK